MYFLRFVFGWSQLFSVLQCQELGIEFTLEVISSSSLDELCLRNPRPDDASGVIDTVLAPVTPQKQNPPLTVAKEGYGIRRY